MAPGIILHSKANKIYLENEDERLYVPSCGRHAVTSWPSIFLVGFISWASMLRSSLSHSLYMHRRNWVIKKWFSEQKYWIKGIEIPMRLFTQQVGWDFSHLHLLYMVDKEATLTALIIADWSKERHQIWAGPISLFSGIFSEKSLWNTELGCCGSHIFALCRKECL